MKRFSALCLFAIAAGSLWAILPATGKDLTPQSVGETVPIDIEQFREVAVQRWSDAIAKLEAKDESETHPDDSILFVGSSSIRLWSDIATDIKPYHAIQRGYGGARWADVAVFAERLISPHKFRAVVFFVANDITGSADDRTPDEVASLFAHVLAEVRKHNVNAPVFYIGVTPTASRSHVWPATRASNKAVRKLCERTKDTYFIGTESLFLDAEGKPRPELFRKDKLHLSLDGYSLWAAAIKSHLDTVLGGAK